MGASGSSSKRKSSKRKSSKISSQTRRRKRSKRIKSKKLRRCDDSVSSYSNDDSRSSTSIFSSSSEDDYRRARSRTRSDLKGSRKRARRSSSSRDSREDSRRVKKKKGLKRNKGSEVRKKTQKKKPSRDARSSSISSDSRSCSTCRGGSSNSSGESEFERPRGRSRENKKDKRDSSKARSETKKNKYRSGSCSPYSRCSESSGYSIKERLTGENNVRRLRSVVTVTQQPREEEEKEWDKDSHKEEIVYDHDDYPSCRSNDSNDGGSKRDLAHHAHVSSEKRRRVENVKGEEAFVLNTRTTELTESSKDGGVQYDGNNPRFDGVGANNPCKENKSEVSATIASSDGDDLESILRLKALENLRKFRGGLQTNAKTLADQKNGSDSDVKQSFIAKAKLVQIKSPKEDGSREFVQIKSPEEDSSREFVQIKSPKEDGSRVVGVTQVVAQSTRAMTGRVSSHPTRIDGKNSDEKYSKTKSGTARQSAVYAPDQVDIYANPKEKDLSSVAAVSNKSEPVRSTLRQESLGTYSTLNQATMSHASPKSKLLVTKSGVNKSAAETSQTVGQTSNNHDLEVNNACEAAPPEHSSCPKPISEEHNLKERQDEAKESSEFEKKTMSVMRGGEMVQDAFGKVLRPQGPITLPVTLKEDASADKTKGWPFPQYLKA